MLDVTGIVDNARFKMRDAVESKIHNAKKKNSFEKALNSALEKNPKGIRKTVDKKLMDVCIEMESLLVARMLKEMRKTVEKTEWIHGGFAEEIFEDMLYDKYSLKVSKGSNLGIAKMLYNELSQK